MPDLEKVIYSIERCICHVPDACRDCHYDAGHPYNECVELLLRDALEALKSQEPKWISVKDRLPELEEEVLVYASGKIDGFFGKNVIAICSRYEQKIYPSAPGYERWSSPWQYFHTDYEITHWMPLPEPPKEET